MRLYVCYKFKKYVATWTSTWSVLLRWSYSGGGRERDVSDRGLQLIYGGLLLVGAVVGLHRFDLDVKLSRLVLIIRAAGRIKGVLFGMWSEAIKVNSFKVRWKSNYRSVRWNSEKMRFSIFSGLHDGTALVKKTEGEKRKYDGKERLGSDSDKNPASSDIRLCSRAK